MNKIHQKLFFGDKNAGFTLIELLVVVVIFGILAAVALPQYQRVVMKARFVQVTTVARSLYQASQRYYLENGSWPAGIEDLDIEFRGQKIRDNFIYFNSGGHCRLQGGSIDCADFAKPMVATYQIKETYQNANNVQMCYSYASDNYQADGLCKSLFPGKNWVDLCGGTCHVWIEK